MGSWVTWIGCLDVDNYLLIGLGRERGEANWLERVVDLFEKCVGLWPANIATRAVAKGRAVEYTHTVFEEGHLVGH